MKNNGNILSLALLAILLQSCAILKKEKEEKRLSQSETTESSDRRNWQQQYFTLDSNGTKEIIWIKPKGLIRLDSGGFNGEAEAILWLKEKQQKKEELNFQKLEKQVKTKTKNDTAIAAKTLAKAKLNIPWLWLLIPLGFLILAIYLYRKLNNYNTILKL